VTTWRRPSGSRRRRNGSPRRRAAKWYAFRLRFRGHVAEAAALAETARQGGALPAGAISNLDRLDRMDAEFAGDLHRLESDVRSRPVPPRPVVFYGSSSFRLWDGIGADLAVPDALNLGFGGSTLEACAHFFERLVAPHDPSALFLYAGDNDIGNGASPAEVADRLAALLAKADQHLPGVPVCVLSIKPSPFREDRLAEIKDANRRMRALCDARARTRFADIFHAMLGPDRRPDPALFTEDMLHMNAAGYARWVVTLRPAVTELGRARARAGILPAA
jgi:lysophospholipase L1-like esterase